MQGMQSFQPYAYTAEAGKQYFVEENHEIRKIGILSQKAEHVIVFPPGARVADATVEGVALPVRRYGDSGGVYKIW